jgi:hypothetical protein
LRSINISNDKKRDAVVGFTNTKIEKKVLYKLDNGSDKNDVKILKSTIEQSEEELLKKFEDPIDLGNKLVEEDIEFDIENTGKLLNNVKKFYLNKDNELAYKVNIIEVVKNPDGSEKDRREKLKTAANIIGEDPLKWTDKKIPKKLAIRKFVFSKSYQIFHVNGLTYDFLYDMAKRLDEEKSMLLLGGGEKGNQPIILNTGGTPYRGFLEGRVKDNKYSLILHLTNLEFKGIL